MGENVTIGSDVEIIADNVSIGSNVTIGEDDENSFRLPGGVRIHVQSLEIADDASVSRCVLLKGGSLFLGRGSSIKEHSTLDVKDRLVLGESSFISPYCRIMGRDIAIGKNFRMLTWANIGGGSCFEPQSKLEIGNNCHLGEFSQINTADKVTIGNEVGIGIQSYIFTHGAYQSILKGYPVTFGPVEIGDNCWLPHAYVLPNVVIGKGTVVAAYSLVNKSLPAYSLAGGIPAKVLQENIYAKKLTPKEKIEILDEFLLRLDGILSFRYGKKEENQTNKMYRYLNDLSLVCTEHLNKETYNLYKSSNVNVVITSEIEENLISLLDNSLTILDIGEMKTYGVLDEFAMRIIDQFRRYGSRFM